MQPNPELHGPGGDGAIPPGPAFNHSFMLRRCILQWKPRLRRLQGCPNKCGRPAGDAAKLEGRV